MRLIIVGAGGHAKVVVDAALAAGFDVSGVIGGDDGPAEVLGVPVSSDRSAFEADAFVVAVGDNEARRALFAEYVDSGLVPATVVHPSAILGRGVAVGPGTVIAAGSVVNVDADIGFNAILNTGCTVDHDCLIGDHAHIAPGVNLCGGVRVGEGSLVGVGACAIPLVRIGAWSVIGAGSAVTSDVPAKSVWAGVPARPLRSGEGLA